MYCILRDDRLFFWVLCTKKLITLFLIGVGGRTRSWAVIIDRGKIFEVCNGGMMRWRYYRRLKMNPLALVGAGIYSRWVYLRCSCGSAGRIKQRLLLIREEYGDSTNLFVVRHGGGSFNFSCRMMLCITSRYGTVGLH